MVIQFGKRKVSSLNLRRSPATEKMICEKQIGILSSEF